MTPPIAILGAGPSGLLLGRLLDRANIDFTIFERDSSAMSAWGRGGSGTLDLHEGSGMLALEEAGLLDAFKKKARYEGAANILRHMRFPLTLFRYDVPLTIANMHGKVLVKLDENQDTDRPEIDRRDLRSMLLDSVPKDRIQWGVKVEQVQQELDGTMAVQFAEGGSETVFRLVVGADGAWSKARSLVGCYHSTSGIRDLANTKEAHTRHSRVLRKILPHQRHLSRQPLLLHRRVSRGHRQLYEHGRRTSRGCHAPRRRLVLHLRRALALRSVEARERCSHQQRSEVARGAGERAFCRLGDDQYGSHRQ